MKYFLFTILIIAQIIAQCDWNDDDQINILDVVETVDCILNDCWSEDVYGCTDPDAINYNPEATIDDGSCEYENTLTDIDGNVYPTVIIGAQVWMAENLRVTHYQNGDPIPQIIDDVEWGNMSSGAYCQHGSAPYNQEIYGNFL